MPAHACRGHPVKVSARTCQEPGWAARRDPARHVRVPAPRVDQLVQLPGLIRQRPRLKCLLDRGTLPGGQILGSLPLPRPIGGLLGSGGGMSAAAPPSRAGAARRLSAPHWSHRGVGVPWRCPPSRPVCDDMGRYAVPWLLAVSGPLARAAGRGSASPRAAVGRSRSSWHAPAEAGLAGPACPPGAPRPGAVLTDRGGEARVPQD